MTQAIAAEQPLTQAFIKRRGRQSLRQLLNQLWPIGISQETIAALLPLQRVRQQRSQPGDARDGIIVIKLRQQRQDVFFSATDNASHSA